MSQQEFITLITLLGFRQGTELGDGEYTKRSTYVEILEGVDVEDLNICLKKDYSKFKLSYEDALELIIEIEELLDAAQ